MGIEEAVFRPYRLPKNLNLAFLRMLVGLSSSKPTGDSIEETVEKKL